VWLKQNFDSIRVELDLIDQSKGRGHGVRVTKTHKAYVVATIRVARIFRVPNDLQLTAGTYHLAFVAFDGHEVLANESASLVGPGYSIA
jgi:methionine-rich copper-binding protein CopC